MQPPEVRQPLPADEALPQVQPPNVGFIVQLFVVPACIVTVIGMVWVMFTWLAQMGSDPKDYVLQIEKDNANSWIAAHNLADELRTKPALKQDAELARELAKLLEKRLQQQRTDDDAVQGRVFLCRALGEFQVPDGMPALLAAIEMKTTDDNWPVKRAALEAAAVLASNLREVDKHAPLDPKLQPALLAASRDDEAGLREAAAYALGVVGGSEADARLRELLHDADPNVVANAATGLARRGDPACLDTLAAMLDPEEQSWVRDQTQDQARDFKRASVMINALRAGQQLTEANSQVDTAKLETALKAMLAGDTARHFSQPGLAGEIRSQAQTLLNQLEARRKR